MTTTADEVRDKVRRRYAESARAVMDGSDGCGCGSGACCEPGAEAEMFGEALYAAERDARPRAAECSRGSDHERPFPEGRDRADSASGRVGRGFEQISVTFTHQVADGMHGAIVKAVKTREPERKGLPVVQPAASAGCC